MVVLWERAAGEDECPKYVDDSIAYFAEHHRTRPEDTVHLVEGDDPDALAAVLISANPYRSDATFRVILKYVSHRGSTALLVWSVTRI
jgi:hypothetical protein